MSVDDRREIGTLGCHLSPMLYGYRLNSPKVVVDSACITQTSPYPFERRSDSTEDLKSRRYAVLGVSARNTQYVDRMRGSVDLVFDSDTTLLYRSRVASARSSRDRDSHHTQLFNKKKENVASSTGSKAGVSATKS